MNNTAIKVENISKLYQIGKSSSISLRDSVSNTMNKLIGKGKIENNTTDFWALRDVSFEIQQGDVVGVIGKNGAGKSTLLKILSRITEPTTGKITINGRVGSLLEVGTGFHPELSGRENIYLNGSILGMKRSEIQSKFDEIVDFSGIENFIDTPVKRYSSGMYVRLAFAVAAHLEPEILIIDEVLAVGDAEFQKKCLGKMKDVAGHGRTVLFVSHNMGAIRTLCNNSLFLSNGSNIFFGNVGTGLELYSQNSVKDFILEKKFEYTSQFPISPISISLLVEGNNAIGGIIDFLTPFGVKLKYRVNESVKNRGIILLLKDHDGVLMQCFDISQNNNLLEQRKPGIYEDMITFHKPFLKEGLFSFDLEIGNFGFGRELYFENVLVFSIDVLSRNPRFEASTKNRLGKFYCEPEWKSKKVEIENENS